MYKLIVVTKDNEPLLRIDGNDRTELGKLGRVAKTLITNAYKYFTLEI